MPRFNVEISSVDDLTEIDGSWIEGDFRALLEAMDVDDVQDIEPNQLREMCVMFLQDRPPGKAAALLLRHKLSDSLSRGQIDNISHEMLEEKLWEQYSEMSLHERLFHVGSLLAQAFESSVPRPDAVQVTMTVTGEDADAAQSLGRPLHESLLVRLLAAGMPTSAPLHRLFGEEIAGKPFPQAESIAWIVRSEPAENGGARIQVTGSGCWLDALKGCKAFTASAKADKA